ncbi:MFS transporter [Streptomyces sp. H27-D2]|uniref:MFS transporter n=1 Tax=Streptomyces sp. H27-D2 TaxID=3046304 RepID=UPI003FA79607
MADPLSFWAVAVVSVPAVIAIARAIPGDRPDSTGTSARGELRVLAGRELSLTLLTMALVQGATFCTFTYLALLVTNVTGFGPGWVPGMLALFGVGAFVGVTVGGRIADARPVTLLATGMVSLALGWTALALTAGNPVAAIVLVFVQGMLAFGTGPALISRVLQLAADAPTLAGGFATAAFNVGATIGPWAGGLAIGAGFGFRSPVWVSALLMILALAVIGPVLAMRRAPARRREEVLAV